MRRVAERGDHSRSFLELAAAVLAVVFMAGNVLGAKSSFAGTPRHPRAKVLQVSAEPASLGSGGGKIYVEGRVEYATTCQLKVVTGESFNVEYSHSSRKCSDGTFRARVIVGPNPARTARTVTLALVARNATSYWTKHFAVHVASPQPTASLHASPPTVPSTGGVVTVRLGSRAASACTLSSTPAMWTGADPFPVSCQGSYTFKIPVSGAARQWTLTFDAIDRSGLKAASSQVVTQSAPPGPPVVRFQSPNWSGYVVKGGPFTSAGGTFNVTYETSGANCDDRLSEWVGLDGDSGTSGAATLVQAGVDESEVDPATGQCSPGQFHTWAWWETVPKASTPVSSVVVNQGDSVTVAVQQVNAGLWQISLTDNTDGQSFTVQEPYNGPGATVEWVTEAFADNTCGPGIATAPGLPGTVICPLAPYKPPVTFANLELPQSSTVSEVDEIDLAQDDRVLSTPSNVNGLTDLLTNGFTDTYT